MSGTDLQVASPSITTIGRTRFAPEQVELIRATVASDCNPAELALFLETCVRHELDPFIKEIWAYKIKVRVVTVVSRDGLLKIANRQTGKGWAHQPGEFLGCQSNAVHEHDLFDFYMEERDDGTEKWLVNHRPRSEEGKPVFGGKSGTARGEMVGSWARVRRRGHDDVLFIAYRDEYDKKEQVWKSHPHAMMVKVAEAMALRKAFSIAGVVGEGEVERTKVQNLSESGEQTTDHINWPEDEELEQNLRDAFKALGYRRAKVRALLGGCESRDDFEGLLGKLHAEADEAVAEAEVVDAEPADGDPGPDESAAAAAAA
jgi:hypothetical protein